MPDRQVKVSLIAVVSGYIAGTEKAAQATQKLALENDRLKAKTDAARKVMDAAGKAAVATGALIGIGIGTAVAKYAEFDQAMSGVAATGEDARKNIDALTQAAIVAGAKTVFSAKESANAIEELAKAGLSAGDILNGGLNGALDLAAAGGLGVADAAGIAATTLGQFQLKGKDAAHVADLLAAGAGKAMGDVTDIAQALSQAGTVANQFGISVDDTVGTLSAFASAGMLGSDAGTSFRTMLLRLANPTNESAAMMKQLGIEAYDVNGKFVGMTGLAGQLQKALGGLSQEQRNQALATIFGQDAIRGANVLYVEGAKGIADWNKKVNESGYAAKTAATRLDNLKGDVEQLSGAMDSAFIGMGKAADGPLRFVVQALTGVVDVFNDMPDGGKQAVFWVGAVGSAVATAGGLALLAVPKVVAYRAAVDLLREQSPRAARALGGLGVAMKALGAVAVVGIAIAGVDQLAHVITDKLLPAADATENKVKTAASGIELFRAALQAQGFKGSVETASSVLKTFGGDLDAISNNNWWDGPLGGSAAAAQSTIAALDKSFEGLDLPAMSEIFKVLARDAHLTKTQQAEFIDQSPNFKSALTEQATQLGVTADNTTLLKIATGELKPATDDNTASTKDATTAYTEAANKAADLKNKLKDLIDQVMASNNVGQDAISKNIAYRDTLAEVEGQIKKGKKGWDLSTEAGKKNQGMLVDLAQKSQEAAKAQFDLDGNTDNYRKTLEAGNKKIYDSAIAMGASKDQAKALADQIYRVPTEREIKILADTAAAQRAVTSLISRLNGKTINIRVQANGISTVSNSISKMVGVSRADGGILPGAPSRTDNMLIAAASGEFIVNSAQTARHRSTLEAINSGRFPGYAGGGFVKPVYADNRRYAPAPASTVTAGPNVNIDVHPTQGMSEAAVGRFVAGELQFALRGK